MLKVRQPIALYLVTCSCVFNTLNVYVNLHAFIRCSIFVQRVSRPSFVCFTTATLRSWRLSLQQCLAWGKKKHRNLSLFPSYSPCKLPLLLSPHLRLFPPLLRLRPHLPSSLSSSSSPAMKNDDQILAASARHPPPGRKFEYGTAGVRPATVPETMFVKS